ncbi:MAG: DUF4381 family protein [Bdellovibrionales bacterium]|nr:DUF4381 family protein [Bdellovibrionales bacterium]
MSAKSAFTVPEGGAVGAMVRVEVVAAAPVPEGKTWRIAGAHEGYAAGGSMVLAPPRFLGNENGSARFEIDGILVAPGEARLADFELEAEDGSETVAVAGAGGGSVGSLLTREDKPLWNMPPLPYGGPNWWLLGALLLILAALLTLGGGALWRRMRRRRELSMNSRDRALLRLSRAAAMAKGSALPAETGKRIGFEVTGLVREYAAARFGLDALEATDSEFLRQLDHQAVPDQHRKALHAIFSELNEVRYGHSSLPPKRVPEITRIVREFVNSTWVEVPTP